MQHIPDTITAGLTLRVCVALTAYPASDGWALTLHMRGSQSIDLTGTADGDAHLIAADAATTGEWVAGTYWATLRGTDGTDVVEIDSGQIRVETDLAQVAGQYDGRGHVEKVLEAIEAVIEGRATKDQERYRINNRELQRTPLSDLMLLRDKYRTEARRARAASKGQSLLGRKVSVRF